jgi:hypothetical protein
MVSVLEDSFETYSKNLKLILLFSIPFVIAFLIPLLAPLPTFISAGGIFIRSSSIFINLDIMSLIVIVVSVFLSLLFISFAFVAISLIVKSSRTYLKNPRSVISEIEKYTARVFLVLLIYELVLIAVNIAGYYYGVQSIATAVAGFLGFVLIFYVPTAIVIDNKRIPRAFKDSVKLIVHEPQYFILWLVLMLVVLSVIDLLAILITGTYASRYIVLLISSLFVLPYFVILQAEAYMKRFPLLKH